ncbi:MAG: TonB family protein, partial [Gemmatimonadota bacterium]|nr:TonB family protein [Gemmatimonadota bacterium]
AGNPTRAASALEGELQDRLTDINSCFAREFAAGRAAAGRMKVRFAIDPTGAVAAVEIVDSGVVSAAVDTCVRSEMERWTFAPAEGRTVAECDLEFIDGRD